MAAITLVTGMLGGCEDNSIATPVGKLPNETALDNNFGMLKCDMTTSDLEITMTNTKALKIRSSHIRILFLSLHKYIVYAPLYLLVHNNAFLSGSSAARHLLYHN